MTPCNDRIEAAARAINPRAFSGAMLIFGCGSMWHYGSHSSHSTCPSCGGGRWTTGTELADRQARAQADARAAARAALTAADALPGSQAPE